MRFFICTALLTVATMPALAQQTMFSCDFSDGFPEEVKLYDLDRNEPSIDMKNVGFDIDIPWIVAEDKGGNMAARSTSWYRKPGTSDDWMVLPAVKITSGSAVLRWKAKSGDKDYRDGYAVYVSDKGNAPDDFDKSAPLFSIAAEKNEWTDHEVSLADYNGKTLYIAFVNNTRDCHTLWIDDLMAGVPPCLEVVSTMARVVEKPGAVTVSGVVSNTSASDVEGFTISYRFGDGQTYSREFDKKVTAGGKTPFSFESEIEIAKNETLPYLLTVESNGETSSVQCKISAYTRTIVAEEVTGTWCGYCVRGIANMENLNAKYGDSFLGIAVHDGTAIWEDPMAYPRYTNWLFEKFSMRGYPHCTVNRQITLTGDPGNLLPYYNLATLRDHYIGLGLTADVDAKERTISARTSLYSARDIEDADLRLCYVIVENNVHCGDILYDEEGNPEEYNGWEQNNYYADGANGAMGGFENRPSTIPGAEMWYQDVARYISDGFEGIEGSVPARIKESEEITYETTIAMPETIREDANAVLAVLLINAKYGDIINAAKLPLSDFFNPGGVDGCEADASEIRLVVRDGRVSASSLSPIVSLRVLSFDGRCVASFSGSSTDAALDCDGISGQHIVVAVAADGAQKAVKVLL